MKLNYERYKERKALVRLYEIGYITKEYLQHCLCSTDIFQSFRLPNNYGYRGLSGYFVKIHLNRPNFNNIEQIYACLNYAPNIELGYDMAYEVDLFTESFCKDLFIDWLHPTTQECVMFELEYSYKWLFDPTLKTIEKHHDFK